MCVVHAHTYGLVLTRSFRAHTSTRALTSLGGSSVRIPCVGDPHRPTHSHALYGALLISMWCPHSYTHSPYIYRACVHACRHDQAPAGRVAASWTRRPSPSSGPLLLPLPPLFSLARLALQGRQNKFSSRRNPPYETDLLGTSPLGPWAPLEAASAALGPSRAPWGIPDGRGGHILAFVFLSIVTARGGQTGAGHFSSKPRLVLPTVPQIGRGGRRNAFKLHERAIGVR
jgi:hypothetical protein